MTVQNIACGDNRYTNSTAPTTNQTQSGQLHSLNTLASYMKFTLPAAPGGESLQSAELQIRTTSGSTAGTLTVHTFSLTSSSWVDTTITWNTKPTPISTLGTISEAAVSTPYAIVLDKAVLAPLAGTTIGIGVTTSGTDNLQFWSGTYSTTAWRPVLVLTYAASATVTVMDFSRVYADTLALTSDIPTIVNTQQATSTIAGAAAVIAWTDSKFAYRSGVPVVGAVFPDTVLGAHNTRYGNTWGTPPNVSFDISVTGTEFEFMFKQAAANPSASVWYHIDGVPLTDIPTVVNQTNGSRFVQKLTFATSATRIISVDTSYLPFGGVFTNTANTVIDAAPPIGNMFMVQGDSITGGSGQNTGTVNGTWLKRFAFAAKMRRAWNQAIGGTGYLATNSGTSVTMRARIADISSYSPKVLVIFAGYNDQGSSQSALQTEADLFYTAVKSALPSSEIYVIGCYNPLYFPGTGVQNVDNWLRPRAQAAGLPYASPVTGNCYDKFGVQIGFAGPIITGTAEQALWTGADNVHPTDAGHKRIAEWMYKALQILATGTGSSLSAPTVSASQTVKSKTNVSIVASIVGTATAWNITQTLGPTVTITNVGNGTFTFKSPAVFAATNTTLTFSITATTSSGTTAAATATVIVKPHYAWQRGVGGSVPQIPKVWGFNVDNPPPVSDTPWLPFEMPTRASMEAITTYRVGGHPMMNYTVGVNNTGTSEATDYWATHWLPDGNLPPSAGKAIFSAPGTNIISECRDRLPFRPPRTGADGVWQIKDHKDMLRWAKDAGFDFLAPHIAFNSVDDYEAKQMLWYIDAAAELGGIKIMPWVDGSTSFLDNVPLSASIWNTWLSSTTRKDAILKISGKPAFVGYYPEATAAGATGVARWRAFKDALTAGATGAPWFWATWQGSPWNVKATTLYSGASETYDSIMDAHSNFGQRDPNSTNSSSIEAQGAAAYCNSVLSKQWMAPCSVQAVVPRGNPTGTLDHGWFWESLGFGQMIASAMSAINNGSNYMEWNTMNDFPEGSNVTASRDNKRNWLDLLSYYNVWFKTRSAPTITRNAIYIANRPQKALGTTIYTSATDKFLTRESGTAITDIVDVLVFLTQSADVTVTVGGVDTVTNGLAAGLQRLTVTARVGSVSVVAKAAGTGTIISQCTSRFPILGTINCQDLAYRVTSSLENVARPDLFVGG